MRSMRIVTTLAVLTVPLQGCRLPLIEGPEIQSPPSNFQRQPDNYPPRRVFPELPVIHHTGWVHADMDGVSVIYIDGHAGALSMDQVIVAREEALASEGDPDVVYGSIEPLTIDGREAWGWYRSIQSSQRGLEEVTYTAVVPYDTITYALLFTSTEPTLKRASPDTLRVIVTSFAVGRTTFNMPLIVFVLGAVLFSAAMLRSRRKARADRLRSINLVTIKKDDDAEADGERPSSPPEAAAHPRGPAPRAGPVPPPVPDPNPPDPSAGS